MDTAMKMVNFTLIMYHEHRIRIETTEAQGKLLCFKLILSLLRPKNYIRTVIFMAFGALSRKCSDKKAYRFSICQMLIMFFGSINKILILAGRLDTRLSFYRV